jgi:hypothetical protein
MDDSMKKVFLLLTTSLLLTACAKVGSDAWCENLEEKPKGDWTVNEAGDYTKYCLMGIDPDEE